MADEHVTAPTESKEEDGCLKSSSGSSELVVCEEGDGPPQTTSSPAELVVCEEGDGPPQTTSSPAEVVVHEDGDGPPQTTSSPAELVVREEGDGPPQTTSSPAEVVVPEEGDEPLQTTSSPAELVVHEEDDGPLQTTSSPAELVVCEEGDEPPQTTSSSAELVVPEEGDGPPQTTSSPAEVVIPEEYESTESISGPIESLIPEEGKDKEPSVIEDSEKKQDMDPPKDIEDIEMIDDDGGDSQSSDDMDLLLIADDSDSSDEDTDALMGESLDKEGSSLGESLEKEGSLMVENQGKDDDDSKDSRTSIDAGGGSDLEYKVKITRVGGGDFEGFEIIHEPVSKSHVKKDENTGERESRADVEGGSRKRGTTLKEEDSRCSSGASTTETRPGMEKKEGETKFSVPPSSDQGQTSSDGHRTIPLNVEPSDRSVRQPCSPTSSRSSENKSSVRLPSSPFSSDYKPSTPGTLSSRSSTTGSFDESGRGGGDSASSSVLRAMRNTTRERREKREERERQEKLSKSEKSHEESRRKSHVDKRRLSGQKGTLVEGKLSPPKLRGKMTRAGFEFVPGFKLEAMDFLNKWYPAKILQIDESTHRIQIHFEGWNSRYDEWVHFNSSKLRPLVRMSNRKDGFKAVPAGNYKIGDEILARWSDCRYYPGKIVGINTSGTYRVIFYDGIEKNVQGMNVRDMPEELKKQNFFSNLQAQVERAQRNAAQRKENRLRAEARKLRPSSSASSSSTSSPPEERKRKLSTSSPTPPTGPARVKRSRSSTEQVQGSSEEVTRSRNPSGEGRRSRNLSEESRRSRSSTEEVKSPKATEGDSRRSKFIRLSHSVPTPVSSRKGHFLMGAGSIKKKEDKKPGVRLAPTEPSPTAKLRPVGRPASRPAPAPNLQGKELRSSSTSAGQAPTVQERASTAPQATIKGSSPIPDTSKTPGSGTSAAAAAAAVGAAPTQPPRGRPGHVIIPVVEHISMDERLEVAKNLEKLRAIASKEPLFANTQIGHLKDPTKFIAPKELIVDLDHNKFKCEIPGCAKSFRKASLLESHMKYYHAEPGAESSRPPEDKDKSASRPRKRNYSATQAPSTKMRRDSGNSGSGAGSTSPSSPPARLVAKRSSAPEMISPPAPAVKKPDPPVMKSPRSPPPVRSPKSPPAQLMKSPKSPPPSLTKIPKSPPAVSPSASTKDIKSPKSPKELKPPKEAKSSPKETTTTKSPKVPQPLKTEKKVKEEEASELPTATSRTRHESKSDKSSKEEKKTSSSEGGGETNKRDVSRKESLSASDVKKTEKTSPSSSKSTSSGIIPSIIPVVRDDTSKAETGGGIVKREGVPKMDKLKHKKHKDKHKKHKDKKKKKKKKKEKEKKKKKKKRQKDGGKIGVKSHKYKDIDEYILEKKKKEFQFEMPLPVSQFKESYSRHSAPILKSQLLRSVERTDAGHGRQAGEGETVRCICYRKTEEGFMIQCERCLCWQHSSCVGLTKSTVPDQYVCLICFNPRDQRVSAKYRYGQTWLDDGNLGSFSFAPKEHVKEASHNLAATNRLIGEMHVINEVLRGLREKLHILQTDDHPAMKLWARSWLKPKEPEKPKPDPLPIPGLDSSLNPALDPSLQEFKDSLSIDGSLDPEASLTPQETEQIARIMAMSGDLEMATLANLALPCEVGLDSSASSMIDGSLLKEDQNLGDVEMGGLTSVGQGEVVDVGIGVLGSVVGGMEVKGTPGFAPETEAAPMMPMDTASSAYDAGNVSQIPQTNIPQTSVMQKSTSEDFDPPTVKFVTSTGTERSPAKDSPVVDISDIPSTSAGPSQEQLEAAGMMRFQPLKLNPRREETCRPSPLSQDESSQDTESSMEVDEIDAKPEQTKEELISRTVESKEDFINMSNPQEPKKDLTTPAKFESQSETISLKEPTIAKSENEASVVPESKLEDGSVVPTPVSEGNSHQSTDTDVIPEAVATSKQDNEKKEKETDLANVAIASTDSDKQAETETCSEKPDSACVEDDETPKGLAVDPVSDVQSVMSGSAVIEEKPTDQPHPTPDSINVEGGVKNDTTNVERGVKNDTTTENVEGGVKNDTTPADEPHRDTPSAETDIPSSETETVEDSELEVQTDTVPSDSGLESVIPPGSSSGVSPSPVGGNETSVAADPADGNLSLGPSPPSNQSYPTPATESTDAQMDSAEEDTSRTMPDPVSEGTGVASSVDPGGMLPPPTVGPGGDGQALVPPSVLGPLGMSGSAPPVPMEVENQPSTSGFTNQPIPTEVTLGGSGVWTPDQNVPNAPNVPTPSTQKKSPAKEQEKEVIEIKGSVKIIKVPLSVCKKNLKEHIEYLEAELEKRMDIIEEEANALEQQFAELPGLSPDIRGLATMNDTFLKTKLQTLLGDLERINNIVAL